VAVQILQNHFAFVLAFDAFLPTSPKLGTTEIILGNSDSRHALEWLRKAQGLGLRVHAVEPVMDAQLSPTQCQLIMDARGLKDMPTCTAMLSR
jgi:hypothetical protein